MNVYFTFHELYYMEVNNVLFAFHNQLVYVLREEKKSQLIDGVRMIDLNVETEGEQQRDQ